MSLWYHFPQLEIVTITYLSITVLLWLPSGCHSTLLSSSSHRTCKEEKWHMGLHRNGSDFHPSHTLPMAFICKLREHAPPGEKLWGGGRWGRGRWWVERGAMRADGADPTPFIPYLGCFPLHIDRRVDWGLRLAATFSQKAREIQYWEWMAASCCQCCNLGNRQSTILVPPLATRTVGKTNWIFFCLMASIAHTHTCTHTKRYTYCTWVLSHIFTYQASRSILQYIYISSMSADKAGQK